MAPDLSQSNRTAVSVVGLLRRGGWAAVPIRTIESLIAGGRVVDFPSGGTVYTEADAERLAVMMHGLLRVYMHAGDGRQVTGSSQNFDQNTSFARRQAVWRFSIPYG